MKKYYLLSLPVSLLLLISINKVLAESTIDTDTSQGKRSDRIELVEDKKAELLQKKEEMIEKRCEQIQNRVTERINQFEQNKDTHVNNYNKVTNTLEDISSRLEDKGLDVTNLNKVIEEWKVLVNDYASSYIEFIDTLEESEQLVCGQSEGQYKDKLSSAVEKHKNAIQLRQKARNFYANEIREEIKNLREQAREMNLQNFNQGE